MFASVIRDSGCEVDINQILVEMGREGETQRERECFHSGELQGNLERC